MLDRRERRAMDFSERLYRRLLAVYPREHREEYGPAMAQLFRDQHRDALRDGRHRLILLWLRILGDLLKSSVSEHLTALKGKTSMLDSLIKSRGPSFPRFTFLVTFAAVALAVFGGVAIVTFALPKSYSSEMKLLVRYVSQPAGGLAAAADSNPIQREVEAIQSDAVLGRVVDRLNLEARWGKQFTPGQKMARADAVKLLRRSLSFRLGRNADLITMEVYSGEPEQAVVLANEIVSAYLQHTVELRVNIIQSAMPKAVLPNRPLNLFLGLVLATIIGLAIGGVAWWSAVRKAAKSSPPLPDGGFTETRTLGAKLAGIVWALANAVLAGWVLIAVLRDGLGDFRNMLFAIIFITFWSLNVWAGILLFQGRFFARICVGIEAILLAGYFGLAPGPQAVRWAFGLFAVAVALGCSWRGRQNGIRTRFSFQEPG